MSPLPSSRNRRSEYVPGPVAPFTGDVIRAIERTLKEYCYLIDANERVGVVDLFSEDCVVDYGRGFGGEMHGCGPLRHKLVEEASPDLVATSHGITNVIIEPDDDGVSARARSSLIAFHRFRSRPDATVWASTTTDQCRPAMTGSSTSVACRSTSSRGWAATTRGLRDWPGLADLSDPALPTVSISIHLQKEARCRLHDPI
jgi:hypothetical protein